MKCDQGKVYRFVVAVLIKMRLKITKRPEKKRDCAAPTIVTTTIDGFFVNGTLNLTINKTIFVQLPKNTYELKVGNVRIQSFTKPINQKNTTESAQNMKEKKRSKRKKQT